LGQTQVVVTVEGRFWRSAPPGTDGGTDRVIDAVIAWGYVDAVRSRVQAHLDAGADHVSVQELSPPTTAAPLEQWRELAPVLTSCA
jgi:hypothetical protein